MPTRCRRIAFCSAALILISVAGVAAPIPPRTTVADLLRALIASGVNVLYSSELVPLGLEAPTSLRGTDPMSQAVQALDAHQLQLRRIGERRYVVTRSATAARPAVRPGVTTPRADPESELVEEVSVFASRYRYDTQASGQPVGFDERGFRDTPGAQGDSIRAATIHSWGYAR